MSSAFPYKALLLTRYSSSARFLALLLPVSYSALLVALVQALLLAIKQALLLGFFLVVCNSLMVMYGLIRPFCIMFLYRYLLHYGLLLHIMSQYLCLFSLILQVYMKRENDGSWNTGLEKEQIFETYSTQLQKS